MTVAQVSVRVDSNLKNAAMLKAKQFGISLSDLYKIFLQSFVNDNQVLEFKMNEKVWLDQFKDQKKFPELSLEDVKSLKSANEDIKNNEVVSLQEGKTFEDLLNSKKWK